MKVAIRVAHQSACKNASKTSLESAPTTRSRKGCTCQPSYYTFYRDAGRRVVKGQRVRDRQTALRAADKLQRELDEGKLGFVQAKRITFPAWVDEFEKILAASVRKGDLKPRTERGYMDSLNRAKDAIGYVDLRQLGFEEVRRFDDVNAKLAPATRAQHLRHLSLALTAGLEHGYMEQNPVPRYLKSTKIAKRIPRRGKAPFEDGELARLWTALDDEDAPVYRYVSEFSSETGMRIGELAALDWPNVSLADKMVRVEATWSVGELVAPKDREVRVLYLTPHALKVLEAWVVIVGARDVGPVFSDPKTGGRLSIRATQRRLEKAMVDAGVPKVHPQLGLKRSFHSLRYSTSNVLQRRGLHPRYIEQLLGHGTLELSFGVYGGWTPEQLAAEAARIQL